MKTRILIIFCLSVLALSSHGKSIEEDTLAFRRYLSSDNIGRIVPVESLMRMYATLSEKHSRDENRRSSVIFAPSVMAVPFDGAGQMYGVSDNYAFNNISNYIFQSSASFGYVDNAKFPDSLRHRLKAAHYVYHKKDMEEEKERLIENLQKFDSLSNYKPVFFATIYSTYHGNIRKYVNALYKKSMMGSYKRLQRFVFYPTAKRLQSDLWVQFAISLRLYDLWIEQVRRGEVAE